MNTPRTEAARLKHLEYWSSQDPSNATSAEALQIVLNAPLDGWKCAAILEVELELLSADYALCLNYMKRHGVDIADLRRPSLTKSLSKRKEVA